MYLADHQRITSKVLKPKIFITIIFQVLGAFRFNYLEWKLKWKGSEIADHFDGKDVSLFNGLRMEGFLYSIYVYWELIYLII